MATEIVGTTFLFITIIVFIFNFFRTRHAERMALINSGRTAKIFDGGDTESNRSLKLGLFLLSIGIGLMIGLFIDRALQTEPAGVFVSILVCGGISLIYYHHYVETRQKFPKKGDDDLV